MEFGISTAAFYRRAATEDALCHIREQGALLCEVYLESFSEYTPDFAHLLRQRADALGLRVVSVHPMGTQFEPQLFSLSVRQHDDAWRIFERVLQSAQILGAKYYVMHGPPTMRGALKNAEAGRIGPIIAELCALAGALRLAPGVGKRQLVSVRFPLLPPFHRALLKRRRSGLHLRRQAGFTQRLRPLRHPRRHGQQALPPARLRPFLERRADVHRHARHGQL